MTFASYLSILRIILIAPIIFLIQSTFNYSDIFALVIFIIAALTDHLDGYVARKTGTVTNLGGLLDLLADKLLVILILISLIIFRENSTFIIPTFILIIREVVTSSVRQFSAETYGKLSFNVSFSGKLKTTVQFIAISLLIISPEAHWLFRDISLAFYWLAVYLSLHSLFNYLKALKNNL